MTIGVLSDTHMPKRAKQLPAIVYDSFIHADHIIHAGDINDCAVLEALDALAPVTAVYGNTDAAEMRIQLNETALLTLGGFKVGIFHGHGDRGKTLDRVLRQFEGQDLDCIIFGHSHIPYCRYHDGTLLFNPGSPTDKRRNPLYSFGLLETGPVLRPQLLFFDTQGKIVSIEPAD